MTIYRGFDIIQDKSQYIVKRNNTVYARLISEQEALDWIDNYKMKERKS